MSTQESREDELAKVIDAWWKKAGEEGEWRVFTYDCTDYLASIPLARALLAAGYERRREHVHSWMTLHGGKQQQCHMCREVRDTPPATPEQIAASRAFLADQAEADELRKQVRG